MTTPPLFDLSECERHLVEIAGRDQERFSGTTTEKDRELVAGVLSAIAAGVPRDHIARLAGISTHTIAGIVERAEKSGEIAGWKERMSRQLARASEGLAASLVEAAERRPSRPASNRLRWLCWWTKSSFWMVRRLGVWRWCTASAPRTWCSR